MLKKVKIQRYCESFIKGLFNCIYLGCNCYCYTISLFAFPRAFKPFADFACVCVYVHHLEGFIYLGFEFQWTDQRLKKFLSSAKSLHRYFSMKHQALITSRFIQFTH